MLTYQNQELPVINPLNKKITGFLNRNLVHEKGLWHQTVQSYVLRKKNGVLQVLIQKRSSIVDIGKGKFDQSSATHVSKGESVYEALKRGLYQELKIDILKTLYKEALPDYNIFISKTYKENSLIVNKEWLKLFFVMIHDSVTLEKCLKIDSFFWLDWKDYVIFTKKNFYETTKTSRFYVTTSEIINVLNKRLESFKKNSFVAKFNYPIQKKNFHFYSIYNKSSNNDFETLVRSKIGVRASLIPFLKNNIDDTICLDSK